MRSLRILLIGCLAASPLLSQFGVPKLPGLHRKDDKTKPKKGEEAESTANAKGVPVPADSPILEAFRKMETQSSYHQRFTFDATDPKTAEIMSQMGFGPAETIVAGDTKQVSLHTTMPIHGKPEDFELRSVTRDGRVGSKWSSPARDRILAEQDASLAKQLADYEKNNAKSIARNMAGGPWGMVSSGISAAANAANIAEAAAIRKQAHDFWEWSCKDASAAAASATAARHEPPPLTDLRQLEDTNLDSVPVSAYEFFVQQNGKFHGPIRMYIGKESGLPARITMSDPHAGTMHMDYFGFNQPNAIEIPSCFK